MKKLLSILAAAILAFGNATMAENLNFEGVVGMNVANANVSVFMLVFVALMLSNLLTKDFMLMPVHCCR